MKKIVTFLIISIFAVNSFAQPKGKYCDKDNWFRIDFVSKDSLVILKPFYSVGHISACGYGKYKIRNDSLLINYKHNYIADSIFYYTATSTERSDSIILIFIDDDRPMYLSYTKNTDKHFEHLLSQEPIYKLKRDDKDLYVDYFNIGISIPSNVITNENIVSVSIKLITGTHNYIKEIFDNFTLIIKNNSKIILNGKTLEKCNCKKKATPIF